MRLMKSAPSTVRNKRHVEGKVYPPFLSPLIGSISAQIGVIRAVHVNPVRGKNTAAFIACVYYMNKIIYTHFVNASILLHIIIASVIWHLDRERVDRTYQTPIHWSVYKRVDNRVSLLTTTFFHPSTLLPPPS